MRPRFGFHVAKTALDRDPLGKRRFAGFIGELRGLKRLAGLRHKFVAEKLDVIFGLNLKESTRVLGALKMPVPASPESAIEETARNIREKMNISCVVVHPRKGAAAATVDESASFAGPFVLEPKISTGAGDHFNAGFCLGRVLGFLLAESLCGLAELAGFHDYAGGAFTGHAGLQACVQSRVSGPR